MTNEVDNTEKKASLSTLARSQWWLLICQAIDENIKRLDKFINDDSPDGTLNDERIYTARVLNIKNKKLLERMKLLPETLIAQMTDSFDASDVLKEFIP